ncbi:MAG TPA: hypothetical protein VLH58_12305 [Candidatus Methylomirabilis sp.]|nr:hypothetical protein [Candidatus Methylomirabilis sp.]
MNAPVATFPGQQLGVALDTAVVGRGLLREAAVRLVEPSAPLEPLLAAASELRDRGKGKIIT